METRIDDNGKVSTWMSAEEVIRKNNRETIRYWIRDALMFLVGGILFTSYYVIIT